MNNFSIEVNQELFDMLDDPKLKKVMEECLGKAAYIPKDRSINELMKTMYSFEPENNIK